jgi:hypothetical protein
MLEHIANTGLTSQSQRTLIQIDEADPDFIGQHSANGRLA